MEQSQTVIKRKRVEKVREKNNNKCNDDNNKSVRGYSEKRWSRVSQRTVSLEGTFQTAGLREEHWEMVLKRSSYKQFALYLFFVIIGLPH